MAIVAILAAVAVPSYNNSTMKSRRSEAKAVMMKAALWMERNQATTYSYALDAANAALTASSLDAVGVGRSPENAATVASATYAITLNNIAANTFEIRGTAQGTQATSDEKCKVLIINHLGQRGIEASGAISFTSADAKTCWAQ
jgi:type IV pilus assembly protein PilE